MTSTTPVVGAVSGVLIVLTGAAIGIGYLVRQVVSLPGGIVQQHRCKHIQQRCTRYGIGEFRSLRGRG